MVKFKVDFIELVRVVESVKKGIDKKGKDEMKGIRFCIDGDFLRLYTTDGVKVFTNSLRILQKLTNIPDDFEFISPKFVIPGESENDVEITVDYKKNIVVYDFGTSKQEIQLYILNSRIDHIKRWFNIKKDEETKEITLSAKQLKQVLDGFGTKERIKIIIQSEKCPIMIESCSDENNKRILAVMA